MIHPCGCQNEVHTASGVLRSISKCSRHQPRDPATLDQAYYTELGLLTADGRPAETQHVAELEEALGALPEAETPALMALEIGCGASPYVRAILEAGYFYIGLEPSLWAADWMRETYSTVTLHCRSEDIGSTLFEGQFTLILAAHCLEHMADAPAAIGRCADWLVPGGELWIVVPDDSDPCNPDHLWYFREDTLRACIEAAGLVVERLVMRKHVKHENFLYARARKP